MAFANPFKRLFARKPAVADAGETTTEQALGPMDVVDTIQSAPLETPDPRPQAGAAGGLNDSIVMPFLGARSLDRHQRVLSALLGVGLVALAGGAFYTNHAADQVAQQLGAGSRALMQSQRLAKSVSQALLGQPSAFADVADSSGVLVKAVLGLKAGDAELRLAPLEGESLTEGLNRAIPLVEQAEKHARTILAQQSALTQLGTALRQINRQTSDVHELAEALVKQRLQQGGSASEVFVAGQLATLSQRIARSANELMGVTGASTEAVFLLGKDLNAFKEYSDALAHGNAELRVGVPRDDATREQMVAVADLFGQIRTHATALLAQMQGLAAAREAQVAILADSERLRQQLEGLQSELAGQTGIGGLTLLVLALSALLALLAAAGLAFVQVKDGERRQALAESQRHDAERQEREAKRINDATQAAILRLMNELQAVAEGDLTQEATVTEDITGAIADSINYTVEELRSLVGSVQSTADKVAQTSSDVDLTSTELMAASAEQLHEIRETGQAVVDLAGRINQVSEQAQASATVARQSLQAAESGLQAVQNAIGGMNAIRDQIQETSKRIKRLGESSQEIGEITELISDITEQTNVLALNAAIQAASAGEAGRGFSVVAEEVQRLAERSADATRQIAALVKAIQTDTQDAIAAMERSTQGVVAGAALSDNAGSALSEIDRVSRRVAELIEQISASALHEAGLANELAGNIEHIFAVTEQTSDGTRDTARQVRELSRLAEELRQSVARFKIA